MTNKTQPPIAPELLENADWSLTIVKAMRAQARDPDATIREGAQRRLKHVGLDEETVADKDLERIVNDRARRTLANLKGEQP